MKIEKKKLAEIAPLWRELLSENTRISPYMNIDFIRIYKRTMMFGRRRWKGRLNFYVCSLEKIQVICPIVEIGKNAYIAGDLCATGYLDFIYPKEIKKEDFSRVFQLLGQKLRGKTLWINKINQASQMNEWLLENAECIDKQVCVSIRIPEDITDYYNSLSKSVRQNYRTSKNRMKRENLAWNVAVFERIDTSIFEKTMDVYIQREAERENREISFAQRIIQKYCNPISIYLCKAQKAFTAVLYIDGNVAGFLSGLVTEDNQTLVIPRLAIDTKYAVYSPGTVLIYETIDRLIKTSMVRNFDLSRGNEHYKFAMGGKEHFNYNYKICY